MLIGNDHASIAPVTLDEHKRGDEQRGKPLRALARSHGLAAASGGVPRGAPAVMHKTRTRPVMRITLAARPALGALAPREDTGASSRHGNDAPRRACARGSQRRSDGAGRYLNKGVNRKRPLIYY
jgi:hypothetical protein